MEVLAAEVGEDTKKLIRETETMGKLPTFPVKFDVFSSESLVDVFEMIKWKKRLEA